MTSLAGPLINMAFDPTFINAYLRVLQPNPALKIAKGICIPMSVVTFLCCKFLPLLLVPWILISISVDFNFLFEISVFGP